MRKYCVFLLMMASILACKPKSISKVSGTVVNSEGKEIFIFNQLNGTKDTLLIKDNNFSKSLSVEQAGIYDFKNGEYGFQIYLKPGTEISINLNMKDLKDGKYHKIDIQGKGIDETRLLLNVNSMNSDVMSKLKNTLTLPAHRFNETINKYKTQVFSAIDSMKATGHASQHFMDRINTIAAIQISEKYMYYIVYHPQLAPRDITPIPISFYEAGNNIPLNDEQLFKEINTYKYFVLQKYDSQITETLRSEGIQANSVAEANRHIDLIANLDANQAIKDELGNQLITGYSYASDEVKKIYRARYAEMVKNEIYITAFDLSLAKQNRLQPGNKAPFFSLKDVNDNLLNSEQLKGKVIYIQVWTSDCKPCMKEIPHHKKLVKELRKMDIAFVSISVDSNKDAWKKMVTENDLPAYQLFAKGEWDTPIIDDYAIKGIPHYILIDKKGNIVNANSNAPSSKELIKNQLIELATNE